MSQLQIYLKDKIKLFGGNLKDAKGGALAVRGQKYAKLSDRNRGILETLYEVYRLDKPRKERHNGT